MIASSQIVCPRPRRLGLWACLLVCVIVLALAGVFVSSAGAVGFGFLPGSAGFDGSITNADGSPDVQAGSHPYEVTTSFAFETVADANGHLLPRGGDFKDERVNAPPGLIGDPQAVPTCSEADFFKPGFKAGPSCSDETAVGVLEIELGSQGEVYVAVYNVQPLAGIPAEFGALYDGFPIILQASVRSGSDYGVSVSDLDIPQTLPITGIRLTLWGVPADPSHDPLRGEHCLQLDGTSAGDCRSSAPLRPLLTSPTSCAGPQAATISADSWADPGLFATDSFLYPGIEGCDRLPFTPTIFAKPTTDLAEAPTGLDFHVDVADEGLTAPEGLAQSQIEKTVVTLPEGFTLNPSAGPGLSGCTPSDYHRETVESAPGEGCPNSSKIGELSIETPLLEKPLEGFAVRRGAV